MRIFPLLLISFVTLPAHATPTCQAEIGEAITDCTMAVNTAGQFSATMGQGLGANGSGMLDGGNDMASITQLNSGELQRASSLCKVHLSKCEKACTAAHKTAVSRNDVAAINTIKKNMGHCAERIATEQARIETARAQLASAGAAAKATSSNTRMNDEVIDREPSNLPIEQVRSGNEAETGQVVKFLLPDGRDYKMYDVTPSMQDYYQKGLDMKYGPGAAKIIVIGR